MALHGDRTGPRGASKELRSAPLAPRTTLRLGGPAERLVEVYDACALVDAVADADRRGEPVLLLGGGSNLVVADEGIAGLVLDVRTHGIAQAAEASGTVRLRVAAGEEWDALVARTVAAGLSGLELLSGIPGRVGAVPIQNVGAYGQEVKDTIRRVRVWDRTTHDERWLNSAECMFAYRASRFKHDPARFVVLEVEFELRRGECDPSGRPTGEAIRYGELSQYLARDGLGLGDQGRAPLGVLREAVLTLRRRKGMVVDDADPESRSAGSFFVNPVVAESDAQRIERACAPMPLPRFEASPGAVKLPAAWLIEQAGFKKGDGLRDEAGQFLSAGVRISRKHALALVNDGGTTGALLALAEQIRAGVHKAFGVALAVEPVLVGAARALSMHGRSTPPLGAVLMWGAALSSTLGLLSGCARGCGRDKPYVPYGIDDTPTGADGGEAGDGDGVDGGAFGVDGGSFAPELGELAPRDARAWDLGGMHLDAPAGHVFVTGLVRDFSGQGNRAAVAFVRPEGEPAGPGSLLYFSPSGDSSVLASPPRVSPVEGCMLDVKLARVGPATVSVETSHRCERGPGPGTRHFAVAAVGAAPRARFTTQVLDPSGAPPLRIDAEGVDADGDGIDDIVVRVSIEGGVAPFEPGPRVTAQLRLLDRPAGLSRDASEPEASFRGLARGLWQKALRTKEAADVAAYAAQVRFLFSALCMEGGAPRLAGMSTGDLFCGTSRALEDVGLAEARAWVTLGDPARAAMALDRAQRAPAARTAARTAELTASIEKASYVATLGVVRMPGAVPQVEKPTVPSWGALAFEPSGKLLVRTAAGVVRFDADTGDEAAADGIAPWKSRVVSPDGRLRWIDAYVACPAPATHFTLVPEGSGGASEGGGGASDKSAEASETSGGGAAAGGADSDGDGVDVSVPVAAALGLRCTRARGELLAARPVAWGPKGLEALVGGDLVHVSPSYRAAIARAPLDQPVRLGSPRAPNGSTWVVATPTGFIVRTSSKTRLLRAKEFEPYAELRDCTVTSDGARVACVKNARVLVGVWDGNAPESPSTGAAP